MKKKSLRIFIWTHKFLLNFTTMIMLLSSNMPSSMFIQNCRVNPSPALERLQKLLPQSLNTASSRTEWIKAGGLLSFYKHFETRPLVEEIISRVASAQ